MNVVEKLSAYLDEMIASGTLKPGDKLPKYAEICTRFGITWTSVQRAYKKLEQSGRIKIVHGVGSFLNGGDDLDVDFCLVPTTFDFEWLSAMLNDLAAAHDLHLKIHLKTREEPDYRTDVTEHKVVITENDAHTPIPGPLLDFSSFEDYSETLDEFKEYDRSRNGTLLPFYMLTYQAAIRTDMSRDLPALNNLQALDSLDWWDEAVEFCRAHRWIPAEYKFSHYRLWGFPFLPLILLLILPARKTPADLYQLPCFDSENGKRMFHILDGCAELDRIPENFLKRDILLDFDLGSWCTVQNKKTGLDCSKFRILPLKCGTRKITCCMPFYLQTFANSTITDNEKRRVWMFLKLIMSKKVQKLLTAQAGAISMRKDMKPRDHAWITREDFRCYYPDPDDLLVNRISLTKQKEAALTVLYQASRNCHANPAEIRILMDQKLIGQE